MVNRVIAMERQDMLGFISHEMIRKIFFFKLLFLSTSLIIKDKNVPFN